MKALSFELFQFVSPWCLWPEISKLSYLEEWRVMGMVRTWANTKDYRTHSPSRTHMITYMYASLRVNISTGQAWNCPALFCWREVMHWHSNEPWWRHSLCWLITGWIVQVHLRGWKPDVHTVLSGRIPINYPLLLSIRIHVPGRAVSLIILLQSHIIEMAFHLAIWALCHHESEVKLALWGLQHSEETTLGTYATWNPRGSVTLRSICGKETSFVALDQKWEE